MPIRLRKFIGLIIFLLVLLAYIVLTSELTEILISHTTHPVLSLLYFACIGFLWVIPAAYIISWMQKPRKNVNQTSSSQ
ncbi:MAG: DUF2842 domain-containing protein [Pseudomonadota bacterium]